MRVRIAFAFLFFFMIVGSVGAYFLANFSRLQEGNAARESQAALQDTTDLAQIDEALRQHPQNKFLQMIAMATRAEDETSAAMEKLSGEVEPPAISNSSNLGAASRSDLEALRRDLKTAEANATTFLPRYVALLKAERDNLEKSASSLRVGKDTVDRFLDKIDQRHAEITASTSATLSARADYYRAYQTYVAVLVGEFGTYKVVHGQFIFPFKLIADRYNAAAQAMTIAAKRVAELEETRKTRSKAQRERWEQFVSGK